VILIDQGGATTRATHTFTLTLPWGAPVSLRRIHVEQPTGVDALPILTPPLGDESSAALAARPKLVAFGDAITMGWCAEQGYPHHLAALNGWRAVNLGLVGATVRAEDGAVIGRQHADLIVLLVGGGEWDACTTPDVSDTYRQLLAGVRPVVARGQAVRGRRRHHAGRHATTDWIGCRGCTASGRR
jgi:hypothetical protein